MCWPEPFPRWPNNNTPSHSSKNACNDFQVRWHLYCAWMRPAPGSRCEGIMNTCDMIAFEWLHPRLSSVLHISILLWSIPGPVRQLRLYLGPKITFQYKCPHEREKFWAKFVKREMELWRHFRHVASGSWVFAIIKWRWNALGNGGLTYWSLNFVKIIMNTTNQQ